MTRFVFSCVITRVIGVESCSENVRGIEDDDDDESGMDDDDDDGKMGGEVVVVVVVVVVVWGRKWANSALFV